MRSEIENNGEDFNEEKSGREDLLENAILLAESNLENGHMKVGDFVRLSETRKILNRRGPMRLRFGWRNT